MYDVQRTYKEDYIVYTSWSYVIHVHRFVLMCVTTTPECH